MTITLKEDLYWWKKGVKYPAEPFFFDGKQKVKVYMPGTAIAMSVDWDKIETAE